MKLFHGCQSVILAGIVNCGRTLYIQLFFFLLLQLAEVNTINESTEILHLSPAVTTEYVGEKTEKKAEFCDRSCEELGTMFTELTGLRIVVNNLADNLQKVVSTFKSEKLYLCYDTLLHPGRVEVVNRSFCICVWIATPCRDVHIFQVTSEVVLEYELLMKAWF